MKSRIYEFCYTLKFKSLNNTVLFPVLIPSSNILVNPINRLIKSIKLYIKAVWKTSIFLLTQLVCLKILEAFFSTDIVNIVEILLPKILHYHMSRDFFLHLFPVIFLIFQIIHLYNFKILFTEYFIQTFWNRNISDICLICHKV